MASTLAEQAAAAGILAARYEADARYWLAEAQRPIKAKGKRLALDEYGRFQHRAQHMRAVAARLTAETAAEGVA